jgi:hypothetical protein
MGQTPFLFVGEPVPGLHFTFAFDLVLAMDIHARGDS